MGIFDNGSNAAAANQNAANVVNPIDGILSNLIFGGIAANEETKELDAKKRVAYFSLQELFMLNAEKPKTAATAIYIYRKADDHDKRGRDYNCLVEGPDWSSYCTLSKEIAGVISTSPDLAALARPIGTKTDKMPNAIVTFIKVVGIARIDDVVMPKYAIDLDDENPSYPEKTKEDGTPTGEFIYFNNRLAMRHEVGEPMSDAEKQAHPAFKAYMAAKSANVASNSNDAA